MRNEHISFLDATPEDRSFVNAEPSAQHFRCVPIAGSMGKVRAMQEEFAIPEHGATSAASSGVTLDRKTLKALARRSDGPAYAYLARWGAGVLVTGCFVWLSLDTWWLWPAMFVHGVVLCVPAYAISHETAARHGLSQSLAE